MTLSYNYVTKGMEKTVHDAALTPVSGIPVTRICDLRDLWQQAILQGVPRDSVATIAYNGRDYRFQQYGNVKTYKFDLDCKLISK